MISSPKQLRFSCVLACSICCTAAGIAAAQPPKPQGGLTVRELGVSTGYTSVQLPPITLGGYLPQDILSADMITTGDADLGWSRVSRRSAYTVDLQGTYTTRAKYSAMSAFGGTASLSASRMLGGRWRASGSGSESIANSDQLSFERTQAEQLTTAPASFADMAGALALARSVRPASNPDIAQAALFVPISQSLAATESYGNRMLSQSVSGGLTYAQSQRLSIYGSVGYSALKRLQSSGEPGQASAFPASAAQVMSGGASYGLSNRTQVSVSVVRSQSSGLFAARGTSAMINYSWSGRQWFTSTGVGLGQGDPSQRAAQPAEGEGAATPSQKPQIIYQLNVGFKSKTNSFIFGHSRALSDSQGFGSNDPFSGMSRDVTSMTAGWYWSPPRSPWSVQSTLVQFRNFGNFSYIYTWHANASIGRQIQPRLRMAAEVLWDRHGSKGFEGFHLTRQGFRLNVIWVPRKRVV